MNKTNYLSEYYGYFYVEKLLSCPSSTIERMASYVALRKVEHDIFKFYIFLYFFDKTAK